MNRKMFINLLITLLHVVIWTSCNGCFDSFGTDYSTVKIDSASGVVYDHFIALDDRGWNKTDSIVFELPLFERDVDLDVTISVRHTNRYPYQNLELIAFLAELDTTNIINSLPIRQNDDRIDSLLHRQDSLSQEMERTEQLLAERKARRDSLGLSLSDTLKSQSGNTPTGESASDTTKSDTMKHAPSADQALHDIQLADSSTSSDTEKAESTHPKEKNSKESAKKAPSGDASSGKESSVSRKNLTHVIEFTLFNSNDRKNGTGMMFVETDVECGTIHLKANTRYKIFISHNMADQRLKGLSDIGITLTGCKKQPTDKMGTKWWEKQKEEK